MIPKKTLEELWDEVFPGVTDELLCGEAQCVCFVVGDLQEKTRELLFGLFDLVNFNHTDRVKLCKRIKHLGVD
jgi:hypothetical protein